MNADHCAEGCLAFVIGQVASNPASAQQAASKPAATLRRSCSLLRALPERAAHAVPERFEIRVINRRPLDGVLVNGHRLLEPRFAFLQAAQLGDTSPRATSCQTVHVNA
jgi:hypothetical protein